MAESLISSKSLAGQKILQYEVLRLLGRAEWAKFTWPKTPGCGAGSP